MTQSRDAEEEVSPVMRGVVWAVVIEAAAMIAIFAAYTQWGTP